MRSIALALLTACSLAEPDLGVVEQGLRCDPDFCGTNSPLMAHYGTWEFNVRGQYNRQGIRVLGLAKDNTYYDLVVRDSTILGLDAAGNVALSGSGLVGARIYLEARGRQSAIVITDAAMITEVVAPHDHLGTYVLDWGLVIKYPLPGLMHAGADGGTEPVLGPTDPVCPPPEWLDETYVGSMVEWDESYSALVQYQSVVFEGDRFDPTTRTLDPKPDDDWFNIGCGAHTLAKLRLTRNTIKTAPKWTQAQAALKMLGADYCGGGKPFTFSGEPLVWRDRTAMSYLNLAPTPELEARWNEDGATCIGSPRLARTNNPDAAKAFPDIWQAIEDECKLRGKTVKLCGNTDPLVWQAELVTSANYD